MPGNIGALVKKKPRDHHAIAITFYLGISLGPSRKSISLVKMNNCSLSACRALKRYGVTTAARKVSQLSDLIGDGINWVGLTFRKKIVDAILLVLSKSRVRC